MPRADGFNLITSELSNIRVEVAAIHGEFGTLLTKIRNMFNKMDRVLTKVDQHDGFLLRLRHYAEEFSVLVIISAIVIGIYRGLIH